MASRAAASAVGSSKCVFGAALKYCFDKGGFLSLPRVSIAELEIPNNASHAKNHGFLSKLNIK